MIYKTYDFCSVKNFAQICHLENKPKIIFPVHKNMGLFLVIPDILTDLCSKG